MLLAIPLFALGSQLGPPQTIQVGKDPSGLLFSASGNALAIHCEDGNYVYNIKKRLTYRGPAGSLSDISPDGSKIAIALVKSGRLVIWDAARHRILREWRGHSSKDGDRSWPDDATFSPNGKDVIFAPTLGGDPKTLPLIRINIATGRRHEYASWCRPLAVPLARELSIGYSTQTTPGEIRYQSVGMPMRWNPDGTIEEAVQFMSNRDMAYALFTMRLSNQNPYNVITGFGLFYLWNGDYVRLVGNADKVAINRWHKAKEKTLTTVSNLGDGTNEEGDPGIYPSRNTPWVLVYGLRKRPTAEYPTKHQLSKQKLEILLLNAQTKKLRRVLYTRFPWAYTYCALSPDAKTFAYRSPYSAKAVVLRKIP